MQYISTRGGIQAISFKEAVMMGLADDGGLLLPKTIPQLNASDLASLTDLTYPELARRILSLFIEGLSPADLEDIIHRSYGSFDHPEVTPVVRQGDLYILELFHGPTLAFKDVALQFLGNLFEYLLRERGEKMNILGATSGDTGSAAIYGVRGKDNIHIFILHPHQKVSLIQELQMTTVTDANVFNLAIRGTFDDGQRMVKEIFGDLEFKNRLYLGAVNSINWARVLAQVVYYFYAFARVQKETGCVEVYFSVPTGNFGDIFAGYIAKRMGLPVRRLILATNENDILARFVDRGDYSIAEVVETPSPSMDIQLASNFERYLYYLLDENPAEVRRAMTEFSQSGRLNFDASLQMRVTRDFLSGSATRAETIATIRDFHQKTGYVLDPHSAIGVKVGLQKAAGDCPLICLATAHPAKFGDAVLEATGTPPVMPASLQGIELRPRRCEIIDADTEAIRRFVTEHSC